MGGMQNAEPDRWCYHPECDAEASWVKSKGRGRLLWRRGSHVMCRLACTFPLRAGLLLLWLLTSSLLLRNGLNCCSVGGLQVRQKPHEFAGHANSGSASSFRANMQLIRTRDFLTSSEALQHWRQTRRAAEQGTLLQTIRALYTGNIPEQLPVVDAIRAFLPNRDLYWLRARADSLPVI